MLCVCCYSLRTFVCDLCLVQREAASRYCSVSIQVLFILLCIMWPFWKEHLTFLWVCMNWASLKRTAAELRKHFERFEVRMALKTLCIGVHTCCQDSYCCQGNLAEEQVCELFSTFLRFFNLQYPH